MNNQRGGIISTIFVIPIGLALMVGIFFLGYYVGKYKSKSGAQSDAGPPLPDIISENIPKAEEFTFYRTLTDRENKTVSIELQPKLDAEEKHVEKKPADSEPARDKSAQPKKENRIETKTDKDKTAAIKQSAPKQQASAKKEAAPTQVANPKLRYTLQIAAYQEKEMAEEDVKKMKQRGYAAFIVASELSGKGTWYRVRLGSFSKRETAEKLQKELLNREGISPYVTIE